MHQLTIRAVFLGMGLSVLLAGANAYLGLFAGLTVSASIPAAVVSMGILRLFRDASPLENNLVQTAASAGEAVAAGAIFTLPALILLGHWQDFSPSSVMLITGTGGLLGVVLTIPLRHALISEQKLPFPEGIATATVLRMGEDTHHGIRRVAAGCLCGGLSKLAQSGFKIWSEALGGAVSLGGSIIYFGTNLSPALLAVGYIVGANVAGLVFLGGAIAWLIAIPIYSATTLPLETPGDPSTLAQVAIRIWSEDIRYLGVGAMLIGGVWALRSMRGALITGLKRAFAGHHPPGAEDLPSAVTLPLLAILTLTMLLYYRGVLDAGIALPVTAAMLGAAFLFSAVAAYMAGLVGSSNNPVSGVTIATILLTALGLWWAVEEPASGAVSAILVGTVVCCAAAIGGDNMQDLKAGVLLGATPWRQQLVQMLGVGSGVCVLAPILSLLLHAYGIGVPTAAHPNPLPAPQASLMAAVAQGVFGGELPWPLVAAGGGIGVGVILIDELLRHYTRLRAPVLAVAVGIYLPLEISVPIALGGLTAWWGRRGARANQHQGPGEIQPEPGLLLAAGLITGEALTGIGLAALIVATGTSDILTLPALPQGESLGLLVLLGLAAWLAYLGRHGPS